ncbi:MAG: hypothetical protein E6G66_07100 [Actinobacteria bacterium]|nr:MAG: hypothetical protein E6G66_07100 [Actinomycetota bacterium]
MGSKVHSVDAASYHIKDGFVTFKNGDDVPIASFATIQVRKVEREGAVTEAPNPYPPQVTTPAPGEWTTPGFGWERPALPSEIIPDSSLSPVIQPVEAQSWERWTDVWRSAPDSAAPPALSSPVPDEQVAGLGFDESSVSTPFPAPVEDRPPSAPEEREHPGPADAVAEDWSTARDANASDSGEWWIIDNPPVPDTEPHQWWIVDDSAEAVTGPPAPAPGPETDASGSETSHPTAGMEEEDASRRPGRRPRDRRERDLQHGWASSLASKRNRSAGSGSGSGSADKSVSLSHQLRARRVWAMEEPDAAVVEAEAAPPASAQEGPGNVVRLPVENHAGAVAQDVAPETRAQENPVTAIASGGRAGPKAVGTERVPQRSAASEAARAESVVAGAVAAAEVAAEEVAAAAPEGSFQGGGLEEPGRAELKNVSPEVADLLEIAAVQAAVEAIVDAAVRGASVDPDDEFE